MGLSLETNPVEKTSSEPAATSLLACLKSARHETWPFDYWLLNDSLPDGYCDEIVDLPFEAPGGAVFDGKRETNNDLRVYFTPENQEKFQVCRQIVEGFQDPDLKNAIELTTGTDLSDSHLRIEYCQDPEGFWLEPHTDILAKKFTMLVYLTDDSNLTDAGTNIFEGPPDHKFVGSAPYGKNKGVIFIPGSNTWHGFRQRPVNGIRKSIIINYVTSDWRDKWELA